MLRPMFLGAMVVIGIAAAPYASADTAGFLKTLGDNGISPTNPKDQQTLVQVGNLICKDLHSGTSTTAEASKLASDYKVPGNIASAVVSAAQSQLC
jgi:hypothetical protein